MIDSENQTDSLIILGASARAAAQSARRAGCEVWSADLFVDVDLQTCATAMQVSRYPVGLLKAIQSAPAAPWIYTGALENYPYLVGRLAQQRRLLGNPPEVLRRVRDPWELARVLERAGISYPPILPATRKNLADIARRNEFWLSKPLRSAAGSHIHLLSASPPNGVQRSRRTYLQQYQPGPAYSALYVADGRRAILLGLTRQLTGQAWLGATGFTYCGSIGPIPLTHAAQQELERLGNILAGEFALQGLFGVDLIARAEINNLPTEFSPNAPNITVIEINPRYTASIEILERGYDYEVLRWHLAACLKRELPDPDLLCLQTATTSHIKGILYTEQNTTFHAQIAAHAAQLNAGQAWPLVADIPATGTPLSAGHPVVTLFASGATRSEAQHVLCNRLGEFKSCLEENAKPPRFV